VPWCDSCSRYYNPNTVNADGTCPSCGEPLPVPRHERREAAAAERRAATDEEEKGRGVPWHFWILVVALVIYLGYRFFQGIVWVVHKL
jgi:hypothetical protein